MSYYSSTSMLVGFDLRMPLLVRELLLSQKLTLLCFPVGLMITGNSMQTLSPTLSLSLASMTY